jgi:isopenicillin-N N-acyltransferase like protein
VRPTFRLALVLLAAACGSAPMHDLAADRATATEPREKRPARGADRRVNGVRVVHLTGTPEEMGRQMGEMCGAEIRLLVDANLKKVPWIAKDPKAALAAARRYAAGIPDEQMRELRATAAAAGVEEDWLVVAATVIEVVEDAKACAAVAAWGSATADGETIVGRNLDWYDIGKLHEHGLVVVRHPDDGGAFLSCGFPGIPGVLTGMNESGLFCADLVQFAKRKVAAAEGGVPVMSLQRIALERCTTAEDAARLLESSPRTVAQNYVVADASGALFLETDGAKVRRRPPVGDVVAGTNWAEEERGQLRGDLRFGNLCACIDARTGPVGVPEIEASLAAANGGPLSVMSVVARPAARALRVSIGTVPACKGPFVDLDGAALLAEDVR